MRKLLLLCLLVVFVCTACGQPVSNLNPIKDPIKVGLLLPETINDPIWGSKGYNALLKLQSKFGVEVFYKEGIHTKSAVKESLEEFEKSGVNLVFGHGSEYISFFEEIHDDYPNIEFINVNGDFAAENVTSIKFESYAVGYFGGMVATKMSTTKSIGIIGTYNWQPEIKGFIDGANYQDPSVKVIVDYTNSWNDKNEALTIYNKMKDEGVDVFYPAGDMFNTPIIEKIKEDGLYAIGFVSDQSDLGELTVLTSTVQHIDSLYELIFSQYKSGTLKREIKSFDFEHNAVSLGEFSPEIPDDFVKVVEQAVKEYKKTGKLPTR